MTITIYHNPRCSKSRASLALLEENGAAPTVVKYLETPPDAGALTKILAALGLGPRDLMRKGEQVYKDLNLADEALSDADLIKAMSDNPILIERPIVINGDRAVIGRPPETVLTII